MARVTLSGFAHGVAAAALSWTALSWAATPVLADGYPPFYGYSAYFGGPAVYYTHHPDVQQTTRPVGGELGFGVRTYTSGGPFYRYKANRAHGFPVRRQREVLRVRG